MERPSKIEVGQLWSYKGMQGRPLCVIGIEYKLGCSAFTFDKIVPWAVFRKGIKQPCADVLKSFEYHGTAFVNP